MLTSPEALIAIFGMAVVTFTIKASGLLLANRLPREGFAAAWIKHIPSAVLASLVAPAVVTGDAAEALAAIATTLMFVATRSLLAAMITGVAAILVARTLLGS